MNTLISNDIWKQANKVLSGSESLTAVIAYVSQPHLKLHEGDVLLCDASDKSVQCGQTSATVISYYSKLGVTIYHVEGLHAKMVYTDSVIVCGSANLSTSSAENLIEAALLSNDPQAISQAKAWVYNLTDGLAPLSKHDIKKLLRIKVIRRGYGNGHKRKEIQLGKSKWIMRTNPLKESILKKEEPLVEPVVDEITQSLKLDGNEISYIRLTGTSKMRRDVKAGDLLFQIAATSSRKKISVLPAVAILRVQKTKGWTRIYYQEDATKASISWSKFDKLIAKLSLSRKISKTTTRQVTDNEFVKLSGLFKW